MVNSILIIRWDWKSQPNWKHIRSFLLLKPVVPFFYPVDTGDDEYAVVISDSEMTQDQANLHYQEKIHPTLNQFSQK